MWRQWILFGLCLPLFGAAAAVDQADKEPPAERRIPRIAAVDARRHIAERCAVEMTVCSGRLLATGNLCFLNSCRNFRDAKNFTVVIRRDGLKALKAAKIDDPVRRYRGKKIRVTGKIGLYKKRPQIIVDKLAQIEILAAEKHEDAPATAAEQPVAPPAPD